MTEEQINRCRGEGFIDLEMREPVKVGPGNMVMFDCPDGCGNYAYFRGGHPELTAKPLTCVHCDKQWWITWDVPSVLQKEETAFRKIMDRFKDVVFSSAKEGFDAWQSQGCPLEIVEDQVGGEELTALVESHRSKSGNNFKTVYN